MPRKVLQEYVSATCRNLSLRRIHGKLLEKGIVEWPLSAFWPAVIEHGAVRAGKGWKQYDIRILEKVISEARQKKFSVEDVARALNVHHVSAWKLIRRTFRDKYRQKKYASVLITAEDYAHLTEFPEVWDYAKDKNVSTERVSEILDDLKSERGKQKSTILIAKAKKAVLLEHLGFKPETKEYNLFFSSPRIGYTKIEEKALQLRSLGFTNLVPLTGYLRASIVASGDKLKKWQAAGTFSSVEEYARDKNILPEHVGEIIALAESVVRGSGVSNAPKLFGLISRAKKAVLLAHLGISPGYPYYSIFFRQPTSLKRLEERVKGLEGLGVADFNKFHYYLYRGGLDFEDPLVVSLIKRRLPGDAKVEAHSTSMKPVVPVNLLAIENLRDASDKDLADLARYSGEHSEEAFNKLTELFLPFIKKIIGQQLPRRRGGASADELMQHGLLGVYNAVRGLKGSSGLRTYFYKHIYGLMKSLYREQGSRDLHFESEEELYQKRSQKTKKKNK
ncbi:sigma-70 family RNA polymerase sigma factor [Candidatus Micrarchaeota archaeon]|nr:sigma-70 family RNA polymerase sigma factor [Candidatus Micrarchaeota archaeon]